MDANVEGAGRGLEIKWPAWVKGGPVAKLGCARVSFARWLDQRAGAAGLYEV